MTTAAFKRMVTLSNYQQTQVNIMKQNKMLVAMQKEKYVKKEKIPEEEKRNLTAVEADRIKRRL